MKEKRQSGRSEAKDGEESALVYREGAGLFLTSPSLALNVLSCPLVGVLYLICLCSQISETEGLWKFPLPTWSHLVPSRLLLLFIASYIISGPFNLKTDVNCYLKLSGVAGFEQGHSC